MKLTENQLRKMIRVAIAEESKKRSKQPTRKTMRLSESQLKQIIKDVINEEAMQEGWLDDSVKWAKDKFGGEKKEEPKKQSTAPAGPFGLMHIKKINSGIKDGSLNGTDVYSKLNIIMKQYPNDTHVKQMISKAFREIPKDTKEIDKSIADELFEPNEWQEVLRNAMEEQGSEKTQHTRQQDYKNIHGDAEKQRMSQTRKDKQSGSRLRTAAAA